MNEIETVVVIGSVLFSVITLGFATYYYHRFAVLRDRLGE